jgi:hypothetical protein
MPFISRILKSARPNRRFRRMRPENPREAVITVKCEIFKKPFQNAGLRGIRCWRREWDSNPRGPEGPQALKACALSTLPTGCWMVIQQLSRHFARHHRADSSNWLHLKMLILVFQNAFKRVLIIRHAAITML